MLNSEGGKTTLFIILFFSNLILVSTVFAFERFSNPVIFIHGIASGINAWQDFGKSLKENLLRSGGCVTVNKSSGVLQGVLVKDVCNSTAISPGDFYLMQFSDNNNLTFNEQAEELAVIIHAVSNINGNAKVILVAHSMGGIAARSYLQLFSRLSHSAHNVIKLITVGTPHSGTNMVEFCKSSDFTCFLLGIFPSSLALAELDPNSLPLQVLNDLIHHPLPSEISYTSIVGIGIGVITGGDGIVSAFSQNLGNVLKNNGILHLDHTEISIHMFPSSSCFWPFETHTCETQDRNIWNRILDQIYQCDIINSGDTVPQGFGLPWNVFTDTNELVIKAFCSATGVTAQIHKPSSIQYHYTLTTGYQWNAGTSQWEQFTYSCSDALISGAWCPGNATKTLNPANHFFISHTCSWVNDAWKCGCRDSACSQSFWQLQQFQR